MEKADAWHLTPTTPISIHNVDDCQQETIALSGVRVAHHAKVKVAQPPVRSGEEVACMGIWDEGKHA